MRIYKARYILLGLTLCCLMTIETDCIKICYTDFTDPASKAYRAEIVAEATVIRLEPSSYLTGGLYNATVRISKSRKIMKGKKILTKRQRKWKQFTVGPFGQAMPNRSKCIGPVRANKRYIFFLQRTTDLTYYRITALVESVSRKVKKLIRKMVCRDCAPQAPVIKKLRNISVREGRKFRLSCRATGLPRPKLAWFKDSRPFVRLRGVKIRYGRKGSTLRVRQAHRRMAGKYMCVASNLLQQSKKEVRVRVLLTSRVTSSTKTTSVTPTNTENTTLSKESEKHFQRVRSCTKQIYCQNGGTCRFILVFDKELPYCLCLQQFTGVRCQEKMIVPNVADQCTLKHDRTLVVIGIVIAVFVFIIICIASYFLSRRKLIQFRRRHQSKQPGNNQGWHQNPNEPLLRDEVDHGANKRTGVFRMAMSTQTDESIFLNNLDENRFISNSYSPNIFATVGSHWAPNQPANQTANPGNRERLGAVARDGENASMNGHNEPVDPNGSDMMSLLTTNNVPLGKVERFQDPAESVPLYIIESENVHRMPYEDDDDSIRETDIIDVDETDDDSSDEENGRLVHENADNGCRIADEVDFIYGRHPLNQASSDLGSSCKLHNGTRQHANSGSRSSDMGRSDDDKQSLFNEVDFIYGDHPLSETNSSDRRSGSKVNSDDGGDTMTLREDEIDRPNLCGNNSLNHERNLINNHDNTDEPEYAISESSFSDGSTPTGEVLDDADLELEIPEIMEKYSQNKLVGNQDHMIEAKPYAAFPYAFHDDETACISDNSKDTPNENFQNSLSHSTHHMKKYPTDDGSVPYI